MSYFLWKHVHLTCVALTFISFSVRAYGMLTVSPWLNSRVARILPHIIDTVLLVSAIVLTIILQQYPFIHGWLTAKVCALIVYILLGMVALKRGKTYQRRLFALIGAYLAFFYIVGVALTRSPHLGLLSL
ncbi:SirB2 family protein [Zooshikella harenae]|uniref:SirB2 family protein n=1 Tax=Zooshikella harenae TaxID=2827238 RepID=A0ABS5ZAW7_9GAMM|nr:SirB2 family protein [Zooshikella harenae]MBU2711170.1 SirB2 family protein [Zooshikella harenae]